jgi:hypothetical protein
MKKHISYSVLVEDKDGNYVASVQRFLYYQENSIVLAEVKRYCIDKNHPFLLDDRAHHLMKVCGESGNCEVVPVRKLFTLM